MVLVAAAAVAFVIYLSQPSPPEPAPARPEAESSPPRPAPSDEREARSTEPKAPPPASETAETVEPETTAPEKVTPETVVGVRLALVIDDLGRSLDDLETLERLGIPLTYAVLPFESRTAQVVAALGASKREVLCHLPMEPETGANPGDGALVSGMGADELAAATAHALDAVPGAAGANNHMGSRLTADPDAMRAILGVVKERKLFFLDSRTSAESVGYRTARSLGIAAAERQVFLDRDPAPAAIDEQLARWLEVARERGAAIAIGHPYPATFEALAREVPRAKAAGYEFVPVSFLLDSTGEPPI